MNQLTRFLSSTLGLKYVMGLTGLAMVLFLIGHLLGNLQVFLPKEKINAYAHFLHANAALLWGARL
ncbi:MAG TPA: succinate:quinone oxidoreductase, partial [Verrucomicrobiota bacterium]|nr:succinate:quinone oxidoreductase [Verrucomicrobiota bacterium]